MRTANKLQNQLKIHLLESSHHTELNPAKSVVTAIESYLFNFWKDTRCYEGRVLDAAARIGLPRYLSTASLDAPCSTLP